MYFWETIIVIASAIILTLVGIFCGKNFKDSLEKLKDFFKKK